MKKMMWMIGLMALLALTACGGQTGPGREPAASAHPTETDPAAAQQAETAGSDMADPAEAAQALMTEFFADIGTDYEAFSGLYRNTPEEAIQSDFNSGLSVDTYDQTCYIPIVWEGPYAYVDCVYYIVAGSHPNTHMDSWHFSIPMSWADGAWKIDFGQEAADALNALTTDNPALYPQEMMAAAADGRNCAAFNGNLMYLDNGAVYQGCSHSEVRFAWQEPDGSVTAAIWLANGTGENLHYDAYSLTITDESLGEVVNVRNLPLDVTLRAGTGTLQLVRIPTEQVQTGTAAWGAQNCHLSVSW